VLAAGCGQASGRIALNAGSGSPVTAGGSSGLSGTSGLVTPGSSASPSASSSPSAAAGVTGSTALFGGDTQLVPQEAKLGRTLAIIRVYDFIGQSFPGSVSRYMAAGSTLLVSMDSSGPSYASIAAGDQDGPIRTFLEAVNHAAYQYHLGAIYICFEHEPDNPQHASLGDPADYVRAWDHIHQMAVSAHLDWNDGGRLHWVLIMLHQAYLPNNGASAYWPGNGEVDIVAADGYNSYACKMARDHQPITSAGADAVTPASVFDPVISFASSHGRLPVFVAEWGSDPDPSGIQAWFVRQMQSYLAANPVIRAAMYWDSTGRPQDGVTCNYNLDNNPTALSALATLGHSAMMQGSVSLAG
jgi:hypothetical protein